MKGTVVVVPHSAQITSNCSRGGRRSNSRRAPPPPPRYPPLPPPPPPPPPRDCCFRFSRHSRQRLGSLVNPRSAYRSWSSAEWTNSVLQSEQTIVLSSNGILVWFLGIELYDRLDRSLTSVVACPVRSSASREDADIVMPTARMERLSLDRFPCRIGRLFLVEAAFTRVRSVFSKPDCAVGYVHQLDGRRVGFCRRRACLHLESGDVEGGIRGSGRCGRSGFSR